MQMDVMPRAWVRGGKFHLGKNPNEWNEQHWWYLTRNQYKAAEEEEWSKQIRILNKWWGNGDIWLSRKKTGAKTVQSIHVKKIASCFAAQQELALSHEFSKSICPGAVSNKSRPTHSTSEREWDINLLLATRSATPHPVLYYFGFMSIIVRVHLKINR